MQPIRVTSSEDGSSIEVRAPFALKDITSEAARSCAGKWDTTSKLWRVPLSAANAERLVGLFREVPGYILRVDDVVERLASESERVRRSSNAAKYGNGDDVPPVPVSATSAWEHQRRAFWFAKDLDAAMLAMDMGTGKSKVTVDLLTNNDARLVLILAPSSVVDVWPREFAAHAGEPWLVAALSKGTVAKRLELAKGLIASSAGQRVAIVINYEGVIQKAFKEWALTVAWDYLVLDESHRLKSPTGVTSKYAAKLGRISKRRLALTGTPFPQTLLDIFGQFRVLDPSIYGMTYTRFKARYGIWGGFNQHELKGYTNEEELREKYHSISFRVESDDVLDLPPITDQERTGRLEGEQSRVYADLRYDFHSWIDEAQEQEVTVSNALVKLLRLQQVTGGSTTADECEPVVVGDLKRRLLLDFLSDLPKDEPVVVFARFRHDLDVIEAVAEEMGRAYGEVSGRRKDLEEARMPPWCNLLGVQMQSGGVGIDLTRARYAVYYSLGFSLAEYLQSRKRLHRPGQTRHVSVTHLIAEGTVDEKVYAALAERKEVVETILRENRDDA